jgi:hypothetical protein
MTFSSHLRASNALGKPFCGKIGTITGAPHFQSIVSKKRLASMPMSKVQTRSATLAPVSITAITRRELQSYLAGRWDRT